MVMGNEEHTLEKKQINKEASDVSHEGKSEFETSLAAGTSAGTSEKESVSAIQIGEVESATAKIQQTVEKVDNHLPAKQPEAQAKTGPEKEQNVEHALWLQKFLNGEKSIYDAEDTPSAMVRNLYGTGDTEQKT